MSVVVVSCPMCRTRFDVDVKSFDVAGGRVRCGACYGVFDGRSAVVDDGRSAVPSTAPETDPADAGTSDTAVGRDQSAIADDAARADETAIAAVAREANKQTGDLGTAEPDPVSVADARARGNEGLPGHDMVRDDAARDDAARDDVVREALVQGTGLVDADRRNADDAQGLASAKARVSHRETLVAGQSTAGDDVAVDGNADARTRVAPLGHGVSAPEAVGAAVAGLSDRQRRRSVLGDVTDEFAPLTASEREQLSRIGIAPPEVTSPPPPLRRGRTLTIVALSAALLALVVYLRGPQWAQDPTLRPYGERFCAAVGCTLPSYRDAGALRARSIVLRDDPQRDNVWLIDAILANEAPFAQAFPRLLLEFTAKGGVVVARRTFLPREYLGGEMTGAEMMPPVRPVQVRLAVVRPAEAVSYRLELLP